LFPILEKGITPERERQLIKQVTQVINVYMRSISKTLELTKDVTTYASQAFIFNYFTAKRVSTEFI